MSHPTLPGSYEGILVQARTAFQVGDAESSIASYRRLLDKVGRLGERILARRPDLREMQLEASRELAGLLRLEGRYAEALEILERSLKTHPDDGEGRLRDIATLRVAHGDVERGLAELKALAGAHPDDPWNWLALGHEAGIEGRFAESEAALEQGLAIARRQEDSEIVADAHYRRFHLFREMGRVDEALGAWEQALSADEDVEHTVSEVYAMLTEAGRYTEALRYVARDGNKLQAGFQRGLIAQLTGNSAKAREEWQAVAQMDPAEFEYGHTHWTEAVLRLGDPSPALEKLPTLLTGYGSARLLTLAGTAWAMNSDPEMAGALFQRAIHLLRRGRPAKQKLDGADWRLLDLLVRDGEVKARLRPYFAVVETLWGAEPAPAGWGDGSPRGLILPDTGAADGA